MQKNFKAFGEGFLTGMTYATAFFVLVATVIVSIIGLIAIRILGLAACGWIMGYLVDMLFGGWLYPAIIGVAPSLAGTSLPVLFAGLMVIIGLLRRPIPDLKKVKK